MRRLPWLLLYCAAPITIYLVAAFWIKTTYDPGLITPSVVGRKILLHPPFIKYDQSNFAVLVEDYWFKAVADSGDDPTRSDILIFEDDKLLGPAHFTPHKEIATKGMGRYSHWISAFVFSSSDNTDPRTNGRAYWLVDPVLSLPKGKIVVRLKPPFEIFAGSHMVVAHHLDSLKEFADEPANEVSPILLYEDDRPLGPSHSSHGAIANLGEGRYSHWKTQGMVFSTSDISDPNKNGRRYWAVLP